jgi:tetratricopeptide (TPR) repeat protein
VHARQGHWRYRAGKFVQRQRTAIAWSAAAIAAAAIVLPAWVDQRWRATREAERAEQVERLIEGLFALPNPRVQPVPLAAATYVDHAAALVRADLQGQPASEARLLTLLGRTYNALGHYQPSVTVLEQALAARRRLFGDGSLEVADTLEWLGQSQHYGGRYRHAETSVREALQIRAHTLGAADPATVRVAIELGDLLHSRGRLAEAEEMLRGAVAALRGQVPTARPDDLGHDSLPRAIRDLANVLRDRGLLAEGAAHYREAIDLFAALHGDASQQVAASKAYYGRLLVMQADYRGAEAVLGQAADTLRRIYDGQHSLVGVAVRNTASLRMAQGDLQEADRLLQESLAIHTAALGEGHPLTARVTAHQAELARKQGRAEEAVRLARQTLETFTRLDLADQPWALEARGTLGEALAAIGDRQAAAAELRRALEAAERQFVAGDARTGRFRAALRTAERTDPTAPIHHDQGEY